MRNSKLLILILHLFYSIGLFSQNSQRSEVEIIYDYGGSHTIMDGDHKIELTATQNFSHCIFRKEYLIVHHGGDTHGGSHLYEEAMIMFTDKLKGTIRYIDKYSNNLEVLVQDSIPNILWTFTNNSKEILGYKCQEATGKFRGRQYSAFFTTKVPIKASPWKFCGLPGAVLHVISTDGYVDFKAVSLNLKKPSLKMEDPYLDQDAISYKQFEENYKEKIAISEKRLKALMARIGTNTKNQKMKALRMEIITEHNKGVLEDM